MRTPISLAALLAALHVSGSAQEYPPIERVPSPVHAFSPRLVTLNPVFLGHWPDPLSDAIRNPALTRERRELALLGDGDVETWALHGTGGWTTLGWQASLMIGPTERVVQRSSFPAPGARALLSSSSLPASEETRIQGRFGLSREAAGNQFGASLSYATLPSTGSTFAQDTSTPGRQQLSGDGWGVTAGWASRPGGVRGADVALGWQRSVVRDEFSGSGGGQSARDRTGEREAWGRVVLYRGADRRGTLVVAVRRRLQDVHEAIRGTLDSLLRVNDSTSRASEIEASAARRWQAGRWAAAVATGVNYGRSRNAARDSLRQDFFSSPFPTSRWVSRSSNSSTTRWAPFIAVGAEVNLVAGLVVRGSLVASAERRREARSESLDPGPSREIVRKQLEAESVVRLGIGFAPPGSPFAFDLHLATLEEPRRWLVSAAYRF